MRMTGRLLIVSMLFAAPRAFAADPPGAGAARPPAPATATAQAPAPADIAADVDVAAHSLIVKGLADVEAGDSPSAFDHFSAAWLLQQHWQIAEHLGAVEKVLGKTVEAANHLAFAERRAPADRKERAGKLLAEVASQVGKIVVTTDPEDAEILVDGTPTGMKSGDAIYVAADVHHKVAARKGSDANEVDVLGAAGRSTEVRLMVSAPAPRSRVPAFVIGGFGAAAAIAGGVLVGVAESNGADLRANAPRGSEGELLCRKAPTPGSATNPACDAWRSKAAESSTMGNVGLGLFIVAGAAAAGTAAWLLWPESSKTSAARLQVVPAFGPDGGGAVFTGRF